MAKASEINRLRPPYLRLIAGGARVPVEKVEERLSATPKTSTLMRAAIWLLTGPLILTTLLAASLYLQIDRLLPLVPPLMAASAILVALAIVLTGRAVKRLLEIEERAARRVHGTQPSIASCSRGLKH